MDYQDSLLDPEWLKKRKEIIIRDHLECSNCKNGRLTENCTIGDMLFKSSNDNGLLYNFVGAGMLPFRIKKIFIKRESIIIPLQTERGKLAFVERVGEEEFVKIVAARELELSDYLKIYKEEELSRIKKYQDLIPLILNAVEPQNYSWKYVSGLHVHHTYYKIGLKPWEYPSNSLTTFCWLCHMDLHKTEEIPFYDQYGRLLKNLTPCFKCAGAGWFPEYKHIEAGICFQCRGMRYLEFI